MTAENVDLSALEELLAQQDEPQLGPDEFKAVFRHHPAGVAVVTLLHEDRPVGFTATSVISVSAAPPLLAFSLASTSSSWPAISEADTLAISFLADHQDHISARFATSGIDRFADGGWSPLPTGEPIIDGAVSWFRARIVQRTPIGDSYLVSLRALTSNLTQGKHDPAASPLVYKNRAYHRIGNDTEI
ncbi:flavin reductase family protein [Promicromonospora kroppenstedtii]|uniref:flavin reductase family protein n=1 Tax=Promicromonospora kroppenstedtii TaxID=440482 RepID=UPI0004ADA02B|nr:flavin reductase family protein [Promicromonospora kroppenstedtii]